MEEASCWELPTNFKQRGMDLLYSNLEMLLSLPLTQLTSSTRRLQPCDSVSQYQHPVNPKELPSHACLLQTAESAECSDDGSPVNLSNRMRKIKRRRCLSDQKELHSDSDSEDGFLSLCKPQMKKEVNESLLSEAVKRRPLTPEERLKSLPVSQCLESMAEFFDNMSFMDSALPAHPEGGDSRRRMLPVVKDGMTDEMRHEIDRWSWARGEHTLGIKAAVEVLSFHKCRVSVAEAYGKAQQLAKETAAELTLPVAAHRDGISLTQDGPCQPQ